jgi:hypothetical protein
MTAMTMTMTTPMPAARVSRTTTPRLRLTPRGRAVLTTLAAAPFVVIALVFGLNSGGAVATQDAPVDSYTWVTVDAGQSLWDLAAEIAPADDPREFAAQVRSLNQLASTTLQPGQELAIPHQYAD